MLTAVVADDEPMMRAALLEQLRTLWPELEIVAQVEEGLTALHHIETLRPDIAFLDIRMPGMICLVVANAMTSHTRVAFVTAFENHAIEAFEANAIDYLLKPLEPARLVKTIAKLRSHMSSNGEEGGLSTALLAQALAQLGMPQASAPEVLKPPIQDKRRLEWIQIAVGAQGQQIRMVHVQDVLYFESDTNYTRVVASDCEGHIRLPLKELLQSADPSVFLQTHRSTVVNRRFVQAVHRNGEVVEIELKGRSDRLRVSEANHHRFRAM